MKKESKQIAKTLAKLAVTRALDFEPWEIRGHGDSLKIDLSNLDANIAYNEFVKTVITLLLSENNQKIFFKIIESV